VLCVEFASGQTNVILVPKPGETETDADRKPRKKARPNPESKPVNAIFIRNHGQTAVTLSHCHYVSDLNGVGFRWATPGILEAMKPGRMPGHGGTEEVSG
jgi:hypothetical protein